MFIRLRTFLFELFLVSGAYLLAFYLTFKLWMPLQSYLVPGLGTASLLFLPHGIRAVVAFSFGLRGALLLLPSAAMTHYSLFGFDGFTSDNVFGLLTGVAILPVTFYLGGTLGLNLSIEMRPFRWRQVMAAGMVGAVLNAILTNLAYGAPLIGYYAYATGDFFGQLLCFTVMVKINKLLSEASLR